MSGDSSSSPSSSDADHHTLSTKTTFSPDTTSARPDNDGPGTRTSSNSLKRARSPELFGEDAAMDEDEPEEDPAQQIDSAASSSLSDQSSLSPTPPPASIRAVRSFATRRNGAGRRSSNESEDRSGSNEADTRVGTSVLGETASESDSDSDEDGDDEEEGPSGSTTPAGRGGRTRGVRGGRGSRGRGRPRGKRTFATRQGPTRASPVAPPKARPIDPSAPPPRATRATVTLPPGYIEGVKSARMSRKRSVSVTPSPSPAAPEVEKVEEDEKMEEEEEEVEEAEEEEEAESSEAKEEVQPEPVIEEEEVEEEEVEEVKPKKAVKVAKGKEKEKDTPAEPERELSKRRKVDEAAVERAAIRAEQTRVLLEQLDAEADLIRNFEHPLIAVTLEKLAAEKALKLRQLAEVFDNRELEYARQLRANTEITWRRWADLKESLREELYFQNHDSLKQLIAEEKAYPFLRDHPLLVNTHDLPLVPYFRAHLTADMAKTYPPRNPSHSWPSLEPPPLNPAYDHSTWELSSEDIASDMALLTELSKPAPAAAPPPPPMPYAYPPYEGMGNPLGPAYSLAPPYAHHPGPPPPMPYYPGSAGPWAGHYEQPPPPPPPHARNPPYPSSKSSQPAPVLPPPRTNFDNPPARTNFEPARHQSGGNTHARPPNPPVHAPHGYPGYSPSPPLPQAQERARAPPTAASLAKSTHPSIEHQRTVPAPAAQPAWQTKSPWGPSTATPRYSASAQLPKLPSLGGAKSLYNRPGDW